MIRHLPNLLSASRLLAAPLAAFLILHDHDIAAVAVFAAAAASDAADGYIARAYGITSRFGAWLDPAADKMLMLLCLLALWLVGVTPGWLAILVIVRDVAIAGGWYLARGLHLPIALTPLRIGKISTLAQALYIGLLLLLLAFDLSARGVETVAGYAVAALTVLSGIAYALVLLRGLRARGR